MKILINIISGLEYTKEMITFNPLTGEDIDPKYLNSETKITYDSCVAAIALLRWIERSMKYTLFCVRGKFLIPDRHFVVLGSWLPYDRRYIILQHGILDRDLVSCFLEEKRIPVFLDHRYHTLSIENSYNQIYQQRKPVEELQQFIGFLYMKKKRIFEGRLIRYEDY